MKVIGITGGIGSGKSLVLQLLHEEYHAWVLEADKAAHQLMEPGQPAYIRIAEAFPKEILDETGRIQREKLSALVFSNPESLTTLNQIVHPEVKRYIKNQIEEKRKEAQITFFVIEAALLIEDGYREICDELWYIHASREVRIERLMKSRGYSLEKCQSIMSQQSEDAFYTEHCDHIIENGASVDKTRKQLEELLKNVTLYDRI